MKSKALDYNPYNPDESLIRKEVQSVTFGFYTDEDVRKRSVVRIESPVAFDPNGNPLPTGLYDARMGPFKENDPQPCPTCSAAKAKHCGGHFGHIDLVVSVYQPLLFMDLLSALRCKCYACHHLQGSPRALNIMKAKFMLLFQDRLEELDELDGRLAAVSRQAQDGGNIDAGAGGMDGMDAYTAMNRNLSASARAQAARASATAVDRVLKEIFTQFEQNGRRLNNNNNNYHLKMSVRHKLLRSELMKQVITECRTAKKCKNCGAYNPKIRQDQHNKLFQSALSNKARKLNMTENINFQSALGFAEEESESDAEQEEAAARRNQATKEVKEESGYDSEDTNDGQTPTPNHDDHQQQQQPKKKTKQDEAMEDVKPTTPSTKTRTLKKDKEEQEAVDQLAQAADQFMHSSEVEAQLKRTYETDPFLCNCVFGSLGMSNKTPSIVDAYYNPESYQIFFMGCVAVPPNRFRPPMATQGMNVSHVQTQNLTEILKANAMLQDQIAANQEAASYRSWIELQTRVNVFMDSSKDPKPIPGQVGPTGIRQILEKKEGLFRKHMMGKRVNYCCRSVISPDPYVGTNEIGLPRHFANILTYPQRVTDWNIAEMRDAVVRGPDRYPGARWVELSAVGPSGFSRTKRLDLGRMTDAEREAVASKLLTHLRRGHGRPAIVGRQLRDGDYVLMNRQPTLHKPGIMAHKVRVLHNATQKTIRMHYANCNTYNADYDGDEMNCHYPQNDLGRAEAEFIANTDLQYIVPTDGSPLRGLIQDHVVGGVKLTKKDTFLQRWEYQELLFSALTSLKGLELIRSNQEIELMPPAIIKPRQLWTGKQVISTLLNHLRKGSDRDSRKQLDLPGLTTEFKSKTPDSAFGGQGEQLVVIKDGELLKGVLDKAAFGSAEFSLVHCVYEAYGPEKAGLLLNSLGRLFTAYIQFYAGHSCRMEDLVLTVEAEKMRRALVQRAYNFGSKACKAWADSEGGKVPIPPINEEAGTKNKPLKPHESAAAAAKIGVLLSGTEGKENFAALDGFMQGQLNPLASDIVKKCLPEGLAVPFPANSFSIMTTTGAKGSIVNQSQVTCALGQQALEGRRVPRMSSGRTLPSFQPFDPNPRADGFVMDRFLTGVRPQEYYFHCMAGREGLVDTAVKTSRSGYLQRCLIKHLEELKICYDHTVRNSEGAVVQFLYGEDGLDPTKTPYLDCSDKAFKFLAMNSKCVTRLNAALPSSTIDIAVQDVSRLEKFESNVSTPNWHESLKKGDHVEARRLRQGDRWKRGFLCRGWYPAEVTKVRSDGIDIRYISDGAEAKRVPFEASLGIHCGARETQALSSIATIVRPFCPDPIISSPWRGHRFGSSGACVSERVAKAASQAIERNEIRSLISKKEFSDLVGRKFSTAICAPGEAVGCIAGQSIGEPSTQMTLNTFHLAGSGANVTLGIPRLREIIMTASKNLKTPTMSVPFHDFVSDKQATRLVHEYQKLSLMELISGKQGITVTERLEQNDIGEWQRSYYITLKLHPTERIKEAFGLSVDDIARVVSRSFTPYLTQIVKKEIKRSAVEGEKASLEVFGGDFDQVKDRMPAPATVDDDDELNDGDDDDDDEHGPGEEDGAEATRNKERQEGISYDEDPEDKEPIDDQSVIEIDNSDNEEKDDDQSVIEIESDNNEGKDDGQSVVEIDGDETPAVEAKYDTISLDPLSIDPSGRPLLMVGLVEEAARKVVVRSKKKIDEAFVNDEIGRGRCFQTAGINFEELWELESVDHDRLMTNDTWALLSAYGVEAGRSNIVEQIRHVFGAYGIEVDPRHLTLIADYMTFEGGYKAMNRGGMEGTGSTLLQMSFETTANFMKKAATMGLSDEMESPSANIVLGRLMRHGTGAFSVLSQTSAFEQMV